MANSPLLQTLLLRAMISAAETVMHMRKTTNLDDISIFVAIAEAGTLSAAATHLQLPVSTISRSLTRLEKNINLLLVRRSQRGLALTDPGKEYLLSCKRALRVLREGRELLDKNRASPSGLLRVACPMTMGRDAISPLLSKFIEAFPDLRVELETYSSAFDQEPKEDIDVFFKVRSPRDSSRRIRSYPGSFADCLRAPNTLRIAACLLNQQTLPRIAALVRAGGRCQKIVRL